MIIGHAAVFYDGTPGTQFELGPGYVERMAPTAFDAAVRGNNGGGDIVGLFNHDMSLVLGRVSAGTLRLSIDKRGLRYEIDENSTTIFADVEESQRIGNVIGSSLGFRATEERHFRDGNLDVREIVSMEIRDVGPVTYPAYDATAVDVRMVSADGIAMALPCAAVAELRSKRPTMGYAPMVRARLIELDN